MCIYTYIPGWDHKGPYQDMLTPPATVHKFNLKRQHAAGIDAPKINKASNTQDAVNFFQCERSRARGRKQKDDTGQMSIFPDQIGM